MRKIHRLSVATLALFGLEFAHPLVAADQAAANVIYTASGVFADTPISGKDLFQLRGEPFSISILANEAQKPTKLTKTTAEYTNLSTTGTVYSALYPGAPILLSVSTSTILLRTGEAGEPNEFEITFPFSEIGIQLTIVGKTAMPAGTIGTLAIRPFTAAVPLTQATLVYSDTSASTTLGFASGILDGSTQPPGLTTRYSFTGQNGDGVSPLAGLALGKNGSLYGTTYYGGAAGTGTVFELTPPTAGAAWTETVLYSFATEPDGERPTASLVIDGEGALYGTTNSGGTAGLGTVFELEPPGPAGGVWAETILHSFTGQDGDGADPYGAVIFAGGKVYGTTAYGGTSGTGTVFELSPPASVSGAWMETILYSFGAKKDDASVPFSGLLLGGNGELYGTTEQGGASGHGTVFVLKPAAAAGGAWTESVLYSFAGHGADGANPLAGLVTDANGSLYGTTAGGGISGEGTVFALTPPVAAGGAWTETLLYNFTGENGDGAAPNGGVVTGADGSLYGTTGGGGLAGLGTVYKLAPTQTAGGPWTETVLASFLDVSVGTNPVGNLVWGSNGALYGTTQSGGAASCGLTFGCGTVFELDPGPTSSVQ